MISQKSFSLPSFNRGFHLVTDIITNELPDLPEKGILNLLLKHTSAAITLNENADPSVRVDFNNFIDKLAPENTPYFTHTFEGSDDMPAHIKTSLIGNSLTIPITNHKLNLGTWQGIYLCEFRNNGGKRNIVATIYS